MSDQDQHDSGSLPNETGGCPYCRAIPCESDDFSLQELRTLYDSSHSSFTLFQCKHCGQPYLEQFHEIIDWSEGDDDIWMRWMPLTRTEVSEINKLVPPGTDGGRVWNELCAVMHRRGRLVWHPNGKPGGNFYWSDFPWDAGDLMPPA